MLSDFTWNMTGYIPKHQVNPHGDGIIPYVAERIFQLEPEPPAVSNPNEHILSALQEKNLLYFSFFLHHYEPQLNKRIKFFLGVDGGDLYDTDRFIDIKLSCREQMLQKLMDYDPAKGAEYATYIFPFIRDAMLRFRMGEEKWSVSSLTNYKMVRSMAWLYHNTKDAVSEFSKKYNCELALAEEYLKVVRGIRNQQLFYVTDEDGEETGEDVALDDSWNYTDTVSYTHLDVYKRQELMDASALRRMYPSDSMKSKILLLSRLTASRFFRIRSLSVNLKLLATSRCKPSNCLLYTSILSLVTSWNT